MSLAKSGIHLIASKLGLVTLLTYCRDSRPERIVSRETNFSECRQQIRRRDVDIIDGTIVTLTAFRKKAIAQGKAV